MTEKAEKIKPLIIPKATFEKPEALSAETITTAETTVSVKSQLPIVDISEVSRMQSDTYNAATRTKHMGNEIRFSFYNHNNLLHAMGYQYSKRSRVWDKVDEAPRAVDLQAAPRHNGEPILIIGSGPTFDEFAPYLKDWKGDIMVSTSQASTCIYHGKEPTYVVALDPNSDYNEMPVDTWDNRKTIMITHPGVSPNLIERWNGPMYLFRKLQPQTPFYENAQKIGYSTLGHEEIDTLGWGSEFLITATVPMLACVLAAQICIAKRLGYQRQYLVGGDLSMPDDKSRFTSYSYVGGKWKESLPVDVETWAKMALTGRQTDNALCSQDGVPTSTMFVFYAHQVITAWRITEADIVNASDKGIIKLFPTATPQEILRKQGKGIKGYNQKQVVRITERYLAEQNIYFINVGQGVMPHEFKDPLHDIPLMMREIKKALTAQGKPELLDEAANMRRIKRIFKDMAERKR